MTKLVDIITGTLICASSIFGFGKACRQFSEYEQMKIVSCDMHAMEPQLVNFEHLRKSYNDLVHETDDLRDRMLCLYCVYVFQGAFTFAGGLMWANKKEEED